MGESLGMTFEIGGSIKRGAIKGLLEALNDECSEIIGPTTEAEFLTAAKTGAKTNTITWHAMSNYGECDDLKGFCEAYNISYIHTCEPSIEYDGYVKYWLPGMKEEICHVADHGGDAVADPAQLRPVCDLLMAVAEVGPCALLEFSGIDSVKDLVEKGLRINSGKGTGKERAMKVVALIRKRLDELLPVVPALPPMVIK